ncbi:MAG: DUF1501 domain-containing protein [Proteobacteria bacterium]|nr:DUF1501 domain-containing protein [Pseudomonadota bacterium]
MKRREFLTAGALAAAGGALLGSQVTFAGMARGKKPRFVFVILRGALDGLEAVPAVGDPGYAGLRGELAIGRPGTSGGALPLDGLFGLHPSLSFMHRSYTARELTVFHAVASPYRSRSHFDGQNVLETGHPQPHAVETGWLNRALAALPGALAPEAERGISIAPTAPLVMRGPAAVTSWSPSRLAPLDDDTLQRIADLYSRDPVLGQKLAEAIADQGSPGSLLATRGKPEAQYVEVARAAARFLRQADGPQVAVFDTTGWDTHFNEGNAKGQLAVRLSALDTALGALKDGLGPVWSDTAVLLATEFGRTVAQNGTRGTDHGTATAAYLLGGAVRGGRVMTDWPGLSPRALYQDRDLRPTLDLRAVMKGVLAEHLGVPERALESPVFPDSRDARAVRGLLRA